MNGMNLFFLDIIYMIGRWWIYFEFELIEILVKKEVMNFGFIYFCYCVF